jgi:hypothetical protein
LLVDRREKRREKQMRRGGEEERVSIILSDGLGFLRARFNRSTRGLGNNHV